MYIVLFYAGGVKIAIFQRLKKKLRKLRKIAKNCEKLRKLQKKMQKLRKIAKVNFPAPALCKGARENFLDARFSIEAPLRS